MTGGLPRVELDHELLVEIERHLVAAGRSADCPAERCRVDGQPLGSLVALQRLLGELERLTAAAALPDLDAVAGLELERRDVGGPAVDGEVAMADELAGLGTRAGEAHPVDDVVEPELERTQQPLAGDALVGLRLAEVVAELPLEDAVHAADLLLLA